MRTAKEICKDSINQLGYGTDEAFIQSVIDEATAYGMTISAEIVEKTNSYDTGQQNVLLLARDNLKSARDNKVWRKK